MCSSSCHEALAQLSRLSLCRPGQQQLQDETVWAVVLYVWQPLDQHVVCKLLCCSQAMGYLIHSRCTGRLEARISSNPNINPSSNSSSSPTGSPRDQQQQQLQPHTHNDNTGLSSWLAHNAVLLHTLVVADSTLQEDAISQALAAATRVCRLPAAAASAAAATRGPPLTPPAPLPAAAAAAGAQRRQCTSSAGEPCCTAAAAAVLGLPLQRLEWHTPSSSRILSALQCAGAPQLTHLQLCLRKGVPHLGCRQALASLTALRELTLGLELHATPHHPLVFHQMAQVLCDLKQLTHLDLAPSPDTSMQPVALQTVDYARLFPLGLRSLRMVRPCLDSEPLLLDHLTAVTELHLGDLWAEDVLPPAVQILHLNDCRSIQPVAAGVGLQELHVAADDCCFALSGADLKQLTRLKALSLCLFNCQHRSLLGLVAHLSVLPLRQLDLHINWSCPQFPSALLGVLGSCRQLTSLSLSQPQPYTAPEIQQLSAQLQQLRLLQHLRIAAGSSGAAAQQLEPRSAELFTQAVVKLPVVKEVSIVGVLLGAAAANLAGAAVQLTRLELYECKLPSSARFALTHKRPGTDVCIRD